MVRWIANVMALACLAGLIVVLVWVARQEQDEKKRIERTTEAVRLIEQTLKLQALSVDVEVNRRGWPLSVDAAWFDGAEPHNLLLTGTRPWIELAGPDESELREPVVRQATSEAHAEFWYNPATGSVRARVPVTVSDDEAVRLYNTVNNASLRSLFEVEHPPTTRIKTRTTVAAPPAP